MAGFYMDFVKRPCLVRVRSETKKGLFHCWSMVGRGTPGAVAIVELENGRIVEMIPNKIQFLDHGIFNEYDFTERTNEQ